MGSLLSDFYRNVLFCPIMVVPAPGKWGFPVQAPLY